MKTHPDARLLPTGEVVSFVDDVPLPNYSGLVYAELVGHPYILWLYPVTEAGGRHWDVVNPGSVILQTALDKFFKEHSDGSA